VPAHRSQRYPDKFYRFGVAETDVVFFAQPSSDMKEKIFSLVSGKQRVLKALGH
jgi:hypothetical protein